MDFLNGVFWVLKVISEHWSGYINEHCVICLH